MGASHKKGLNGRQPGRDVHFQISQEIYSQERYLYPETLWNSLATLGASLDGVNEKHCGRISLSVCVGEKPDEGGGKGGGGLSSLDENQTLQTHPPLALPVLPKTGASSHRRRRERFNRMEESMKETT